jgi:hypothetical protein
VKKRKSDSTLPSASPPRLTELERCHARWRSLWLGVIWTLEEQDPEAYARIMVKLEKHGLVGDRREIRNGHEFPMPQGALTSIVPSPQILEASGSFCNDRQPVSLKGKTRDRPPLSEMLLFYYGARWYIRQAAIGAERGQDSAEVRTLQLVAGRYGYDREDLDTARTYVKRAKRLRTAADKTKLQRSGKILWELFQSAK